MKICPFKFDDPYNSYCVGNRCAFFVDGKCAVVVIAENSKEKEKDGDTDA